MTLTRNDLLRYGRLVVKKYDGDPNFQERIDEHKTHIKYLETLSPVQLRKELSKADEKIALKSWKDLGIGVIEIKPLDN